MQDWLESNNLHSLEKIFKKRNVTLEELCEFKPEDLKEFAEGDLGLDKNLTERFLIAVAELQYDRKQPSIMVEKKKGVSTSEGDGQNDPNKHVMIFPEEEKALKELENTTKEVASVVESIEQTVTQWTNEAQEVQNNKEKLANPELNTIIDKDIVPLVVAKQKLLLSRVEDIMQKKEDQLKKQRRAVSQICDEVKVACMEDLEAYMNRSDPKMDKEQSRETLRGIQTKMDQLYETQSFITALNGFSPWAQPNIKVFGIDDGTLIKMSETLKVDRCDQPMPPTVKIASVGSDHAKIKWNQRKDIHPVLMATHFAADICPVVCEERHARSLAQGQSVLADLGVANRRASIFGGGGVHQRFLDFVNITIAGSDKLEWQPLIHNTEIDSVSGVIKDQDNENKEKDKGRGKSSRKKRKSASEKDKRLSLQLEKDCTLYIYGLESSGLYLVRVREKNMFGWGEWSKPTPLITEAFKLAFSRKSKCKLSDGKTTLTNNTGQPCFVPLGETLHITKNRKIFAKTRKNSKRSQQLRGLSLDFKLKFQAKNNTNSSQVYFAVGICSKAAVKVIKPYMINMRFDQSSKPADNYKGGIFFSTGMIWHGVTAVETNYQNKKGLWQAGDTVSIQFDSTSKQLQGTFWQGWLRGSKSKKIDIDFNDVVLFVWLSENTKVTIVEQKSEIKAKAETNPDLEELNEI